MSKKKQLILTNYNKENWEKFLQTEYSKVFNNDDIVQIKCYYLTYPEIRDEWSLSNSKVLITRVIVDKRRRKTKVYNEPRVGSFLFNYAEPKRVYQWYGEKLIHCPTDEDLTGTVIIEEATLSQKLLFTLAYIRGED